jgi:MFS family permease
MNKALIPILGITLVDVLGFTMLIPILPYYAQHFGASPLAIGGIYATVAGFALVFSPIWGRVSDRIGRRGVLLIAQGAAVAGFGLLAFANALWVIYLARAIEGIGGGGLGVTQAYVSDVTTPEERSRAFGLIGATFGIGFLIGPALSGFLVQWGYRVPLLVGASLAVCTVLLTVFLLPESHKPVATGAGIGEIAAAFETPGLRPLLFVQFAFNFAFYCWISVFALFVQHVLNFGPTQSSWIFVVTSLIGIIVQGRLIGPITDRFGEGRVALTGFLVAIAGYAVVPYIGSVPALLGMAILWALSGALIRPSMSSLFSQRAPADLRGTLFGVNDALSNIAFIIAALVATTVFSRDVEAVGVLPMLGSIGALAVGYRLFVTPRLEVAQQ